MKTCRDICDTFEGLLRLVRHSEHITNKYPDFNRFVAEMLSVESADVYTAYVSKADRFSVRMRQSDHTQAWLRVALVPAELDNQRDLAKLKAAAMRNTRKNPGTAVLLVCDGQEGWRPRWGLQPASSGLPSTESCTLSCFLVCTDFALETYEHTAAGSVRTLTEREEELLRALSARPQTSKLLYELDPDVFASLIKHDVGAQDVVAIAHRKAVIDKFRRLLFEPDFFSEAAQRFGGRREPVWQNLLEENPWILGVSLAGQLLIGWDREKLEQTVAGAFLKRPGKRVDALMQTKGRISAMVFAEIKHHDTPLLGAEPRTGCWAPSRQLSEGIAQIQQTVHFARKQIGQEFRKEDDSGAEEGESAYLIRPRQFLIIGNLQSLCGPNGIHPEKFQSFELYRRSLVEPEIITFDELLARAEWHVGALDEAPQHLSQS